MHISWPKKQTKKQHLLATIKQRTKTTKAVDVVLTITSRNHHKNFICNDHRSDLNHFYLLEFLLNSFTVSLQNTNFFCSSFIWNSATSNLCDAYLCYKYCKYSLTSAIFRWWQPSERSNFWEAASVFRRKFLSKICDTQAAKLSTNYVIWSKLSTSSNMEAWISHPLHNFVARDVLAWWKLWRQWVFNKEFQQTTIVLD